jgi:hypothetical protein
MWSIAHGTLRPRSSQGLHLPLSTFPQHSHDLITYPFLSSILVVLGIPRQVPYFFPMMFRRSPLLYGRYRRPFAKLCYVVFLVLAAAFWNLYDAISHSQRPQSYPAADHEPVSGGHTEGTNNPFAVQLPLVPVSDVDVDVDVTPSESRHQGTRSVVFVPNIRPQADVEATSPIGNGAHDARPRSRTEHRNDGHAHVASSGSRVARKKSQTVAKEAHNQDDGDTMLPIRNMPVKQELGESVKEKSHRVTAGLFDDYPAREAQEVPSFQVDILHRVFERYYEHVGEHTSLLLGVVALVMRWETITAEDDWVSKARYTGPKLKEPKLDFVYNCMCICIQTRVMLTSLQG